MADELQISIVSDIGGWGFSAEQLVRELQGFGGETITVPINSYGGSVTEGLAIYNILKGSKQTVNSNVLGYAMSMGTIVACAGDYVTAPKNSYYMIHNPWGVVAGDHEEMQSHSDLLESMADQLASIYHTTSKKRKGDKATSKAEFRELMKAETWLTAAQAKKHGLIDKVTDGAILDSASMPDPVFMAKLKNVPQGILNIDNNLQENKMGIFDGVFSKKPEQEKPEDKPTADYLTREEFKAAMQEYTVELATEWGKETQAHFERIETQIKGLKDANEALVAKNDELKSEKENLETEINGIKVNAGKKSKEILPKGMNLVDEDEEDITKKEPKKSNGMFDKDVFIKGLMFPDAKNITKSKNK